MSALTGDNVVESLGGMPWYEGQTILQHLEANADNEKGKVRFPVQTLFDQNRRIPRGYAGKLCKKY
jgi:sulfate adenylyltransferase subunit 1